MQGSASGQLWNDTVSLGGHELDNQTVALCDEVSGTLLGGNASGIMGKRFFQAVRWSRLASS